MPAQTPAPAGDISHAKRRRVLLVEDTETTRRRISDMLRANGYDVAEVSDGLQALKAVSSERFDAIVLDLLLPHVDGWQFRETQLRHPELADIPTIVVTVHPLRQPERYALRTPNIVRKPFEDGELLAAVHRACTTQQPMRAPRTEPIAPAELQLFWSKRGEIACANHAPSAQSSQWVAEQWAPIPASARYQQIVYQCQHCPGHSGPIRRGK